jgi:hypothetical protein
MGAFSLVVGYHDRRCLPMCHMPQISAGPLTNPNSSDPFTGVIAMSLDRGGCEGKSDCTFVVFRNGQQVSASTYNQYMMRPTAIALPISFPAGPVYYNQISGDPTIILCNPTGLCRMRYLATVGASQTWTSLIDRQLIPLVGANPVFLQSEINQLNAAALQYQATIATLRDLLRTAKREKDECAEKLRLALIPKVVVAASGTPVPTTATKAFIDTLKATPGQCPPPPPIVKPPAPKVGCCGEVDSVAGFLAQLDGKVSEGACCG